jgi:hypothetical protein
MLSVVVVYSCGNNNDPMSPYNPEIINNTNNFEFQITAAENLDHAENYIWRNNGSQATINQSCSITAGRATVFLSDSTGAVLYTGDLTDNGTFQSAAGVAGSWTIRIEFVNLDGTVNFRTQRL